MYDNQYMYGRNSFNDRPSRKQKKEQKKSQKKKKKSNPFGRGFINSEDVEPFQMSEKDKKFWNELSSKTTTKPKDWETEKATNDVFEPIRQVAEHLTRVPRTKPPHLAWFENVGKMRDWYLESLAQGSPLSDATEPLAQANCSKCIMQKSVSINAFYLTRMSYQTCTDFFKHN